MSQVTSESDLDKLRQEVERASGQYYHTALQQGIDNRTKSFVIERCHPFVRGPRILELGYVDGLWTDRLVELGSVDLIEGASKHVEHARQRYAGRSEVQIIHRLFQEHEPSAKYNTVIAGDMLRYVPEPVVFLRKVASWLAPKGRLIATIPNSRSMHRRVGSLMGLEPTPTRANQRDIEVGNLRSYDRYEFRSLLRESGFLVEELHGCFLKPLSSSQMAEWDDRLLRAFLAMGDELEDYCWFIYAVCSVEQNR